MPTPGERFDRLTGSQPFKPESRALDPREVKIQSGWNVRDMSSPDTREHIETLKASIIVRGVDKPISVRYDRVSGVTTLVDGQCRLTACQELWKAGNTVYVPAIRVTGDEAELTAESLTSNTGRPLTQWEIGAGCRRLLKFGWSRAVIAQHICKSTRYVNEAIALADAPLEAKAMLNEGTVTPGAVLHAVKTQGDKAVKVLKQRVAAAPKPAQTSIPGTAKHPKPVARPKKPSAAETVAKSAPSLLELADAMYKAFSDLYGDEDELPAPAKAYWKARNL